MINEQSSNKSVNLDIIQARSSKPNNISEENMLMVKNKLCENDNIPLYQLKEIEGSMINPEIINFCHYGMIGGLRNQKDGYAYFGYKKTGLNNKVINDFVLNNPNNIIIETDHVFRIGFTPGK